MKPDIKLVVSHTISNVAKLGLIYLGTPYSKYPKGLEAAFKDASALTAKLLRAGVKVYSPIAHTHPVAIYGHLDPLDHAIWLPFDRAIMDKADAMLVAEMTGWKESRGIAHEIDVFTAAQKPVYYINPDTLEVHQ